MAVYLILGCGYTGSRVARKLLAWGSRVICTNRQRTEISGADCIPLEVGNPIGFSHLSGKLSEGMIVLHSIPTAERTAMLLDALRPFHPSRIVYISTTGVYGKCQYVDHNTVPDPEMHREKERHQTEQAISNGPWSSLVLRPAAIYGPGRGIHTFARTGIFRPPPGGDRIVSRIHVEDLAEHLVAGLQSEISGAFPVADEEPSRSIEVAEWTAAFLSIPLPLEEGGARLRDEHRAGRRVDGSAYRRALGLRLRYPSFREGVPACLRAEGFPRPNSAELPG